jgi:NAD(P)H dehydrogenase (quinone)
MYAVMGITGQVGAAVAETLLARGQKVRAIVRNPEKAATWKARGVELALADYDDAQALEAAFRGANGVFVMVPPNFAPAPGFPEVRATVAAIRTALEKTKPRRAVYLSSIGAQQTSGVGLITTLHILEESFRSLPIPNAFLRAGWFMQNCLWDVAPAREQGKLFSFLQPLDHKFPLVATEDIGSLAAKILTEDWTGNRFLEVAGPQGYSPNEIASTFSTILGRSVEAVAVPRDTWVSQFVAQGTPEDRTANRVEMIDGFNSGWIDFHVPNTEHHQGTTSLKTVLQNLVGQN